MPSSSAAVLGTQPVAADANTKNVPTTRGNGRTVTQSTAPPKNINITAIPAFKIAKKSLSGMNQDTVRPQSGPSPNMPQRSPAPTRSPEPSRAPITRDMIYGSDHSLDTPQYKLTPGFDDYFKLMDQIKASAEAAEQKGQEYILVNLDYYNRVLTRVKSESASLFNRIYNDGLDYAVKRSRENREHDLTGNTIRYVQRVSQEIDISVFDIIANQKAKGVMDIIVGIVSAAAGIALATVSVGTAILVFPFVVDRVFRAKAGAELAYNATLGKIAVKDVHWIRGAIAKEYQPLYDFGIEASLVLAQWSAAVALAKRPIRIRNVRSNFGTGKKANPNNVKVNKGQQDKHIKGTNNYKQELANGKPRSVLTEDPQQLLDDFAGSGQTVGGNKERIDFGDVIGQFYDSRTGQYVDTTNGIIHYDSKGGAHIVPGIPNGYN